jgi:hypothetical protein
LGARRSISFSDADFYGLDVSEPVAITITIGELNDALKSVETYGQYLRSFNPETNAIDDEPESGRETVLTLRLAVKNDLEPLWTLVSDRADAQGQAGALSNLGGPGAHRGRHFSSVQFIVRVTDSLLLGIFLHASTLTPFDVE